MRITTLAVIGIGSATAVAFAQVPAATPATVLHEPVVTSEIFVEKATQTGLYEVEAGRVAMSRSTDPGVKVFAERMVKDHGAVGAELTNMVAGTAYPATKKLDVEHEAKLKDLKSVAAGKFDAAYGKDMVDGHEQAVTLFTQASSATEVTPGLRGFARKTLPMLQSHYEAAKSLPHPAK